MGYTVINDILRAFPCNLPLSPLVDNRFLCVVFPEMCSLTICPTTPSPTLVSGCDMAMPVVSHHVSKPESLVLAFEDLTKVF